MEFEYSKKTKMYQEQLVDFMGQHIYPNEQTFVRSDDRPAQSVAGAPHHGGAEGQGARARASGTCSSPRASWARADQSGVCAALRDHGPLPHRGRGLQLRRPRHRQHGGAHPLRDARAEEAVAGAPPRRQDPLGLRHDRTQGRLLGRHQHRVGDQARRGPLRHQRPQVVDVGHRRPALQGPDLHGQDRRREPRPLQAAVDDPGSPRRAGHQDPADADGVRLRRRAPRPRRGSLRERARPRHQHASGRGPRLRDRAGAAGTRPDSPLHAPDRRGRAGAGADVPACARARGLRQAAERERHHPRAHRPVAHRDRAGAPARPQRRLDDGHRRQQGGPTGHRRPSRWRCPT